MKHIIYIILFLLPLLSNGQVTYIPVGGQDNANQFRVFNGRGEFKQGFRLPVQGGHSIPAGDSLWFVRVNPNDGQLYMWNGLSWGCISCGGGGTVDTTSLSNRIDGKIDSVKTSVDSVFVKYNGTWHFAGIISAQGAGVSWGSIGGTLSAQTDLANALNDKLNVSDTATMLGTYLRKADTASMSTRINARVAYVDTATMLNPYLRKGDTASLSTRINAKMGYSDTVSLSNRINAKLNISDTSTMLGSYLRKADTASLSNRINLKLNIADTSGMLSPYFRKVDTTGKWLSASTYIPDTTSLSTRIDDKLSTTDTATMLSPYAKFSDIPTSLPPTGSAGGDLTGTYPNPAIANGVVSNSNLANMVNGTVKGRYGVGTGSPQDMTFSQLKGFMSLDNVDNTSDINKPVSTATQNALNLKIDSVKTSVDSVFVKYNSTWYFAGIISAQGAGVSWGSIGGTLSSQTDLQNALNAKLNTSDSTIYFSVSRALDSLSDHWLAIEGKLSSSDGRIANWTAAYNDKINSAAFSGTTTKTLTLTQQDAGTVTASFTDDNTTYTGSTSITLTGGSFQRAALTGDVTASANNNATTIANNAVTNAKAADMAVNTIKGRITAGTGDPQDLTATQVRTIINVADGAEVNVNADWNAVSGDAQILNKPAIPDISGLAPQQALDDSMVIVRDSISALRADIGSGGGGGGLDTTAGDARYWKQGGNSFLPSPGTDVLGTANNNSLNIITNNMVRIGLLNNGGINLNQVSSGNAGVYINPNGNTAIGKNTTGARKLEVQGDVLVSDLAGSGTRMVVADPSGVLGTQAIPDTTSLSNRINLKLDITDTSGKWIPAGTTVTNWSGGSTGLNAATGRTSLGGTTVGQNLFTLTNPSAITFLRINANNTVSALSASDFRTAIGAGTGTVTSVGLSVPTGFSVSGSPVTTSGTITLSYAAGYQGYTSTEASKLSNIEANADVTDATNVAAAGAVMFTDTATTVATKTDLITNRLVTFNTQSGTSYTLVAGDFDGRTVVLSGNANPITITVPPGMVIGSSVLVEQTGAGQITFDPGSGVTLHSFESKLTTAGTNATVTIYCKDTDTYTLSGNLE